MSSASRTLLRFALWLPVSASLTPAYAQQVFSYYNQPAPVYLPGLPAPPPNSQHLRVLPRAIPQQELRPLELNVRPRALPESGPRIRPPPKTQPEKPPQVARKARPMDEKVNPLPLLLRDDTLRPGDMVMFPDGLRVFSGPPGGKHTIHDFVAAAKKLSRSALASLKRLQPSTNDSWDDKVLSKNGGPRDQEIASNPYKNKLTPAP